MGEGGAARADGLLGSAHNGPVSGGGGGGGGGGDANAAVGWEKVCLFVCVCAYKDT